MIIIAIEIVCCRDNDNNDYDKKVINLYDRIVGGGDDDDEDNIDGDNDRDNDNNTTTTTTTTNDNNAITKMTLMLTIKKIITMIITTTLMTTITMTIATKSTLATYLHHAYFVEHETI